jgi:hypothetical protein
VFRKFRKDVMFERGNIWKFPFEKFKRLQEIKIFNLNRVSNVHSASNHTKQHSQCRHHKHKFITAINTRMQSTNTGRKRIWNFPKRTNKKIIAKIFFQSCHVAKRPSKTSSKESPNVGKRVACNWSATIKRLGKSNFLRDVKWIPH